MFEINISKDAGKFLKKLNGKPLRQVKTKLLLMLENPFPQDSSKLQGYPFYRVDSGEYRIIYFVEGNVLNIKIIGKRNDDEVYKKLKRSEK